uniref:Uncharacterized protein n=1 Tax=Caenorhabditis japonica TaxID=281687 RepID=A0A8R1E6N5_CAEJA
MQNHPKGVAGAIQCPVKVHLTWKSILSTPLRTINMSINAENDTRSNNAAEPARQGRAIGSIKAHYSKIVKSSDENYARAAQCVGDLDNPRRSSNLRVLKNRISSNIRDLQNYKSEIINRVNDHELLSREGAKERAIESIMNHCAELKIDNLISRLREMLTIVDRELATSPEPTQEELQREQEAMEQEISNVSAEFLQFDDDDEIEVCLRDVTVQNETTIQPIQTRMEDTRADSNINFAPQTTTQTANVHNQGDSGKMLETLIKMQADIQKLFQLHQNNIGTNNSHHHTSRGGHDSSGGASMMSAPEMNTYGLNFGNERNVTRQNITNTVNQPRQLNNIVHQNQSVSPLQRAQNTISMTADGAIINNFEQSNRDQVRIQKNSQNVPTNKCDSYNHQLNNQFSTTPRQTEQISQIFSPNNALQRTLPSFQNSTLPNQNSQQYQNHNMYFPNVKELLDTIPTFSGEDPDIYPEFITQFNELVHLNPTMSIPVKYSVLKRLLTGGAAILITTSTFSEEDYYNTLNLLRVTYGTDRRQSVMRKFRQAQFHATNYDEMERDLIIHVTLANKLKIHGVQVDNPMVIDEFIQKLPYHIMTSIIKKTKDNNHTFEEIIRLVRDQIGISRYVEQARDKKKLSEVVNEVYVQKETSRREDQ